MKKTDLIRLPKIEINSTSQLLITRIGFIGCALGLTQLCFCTYLSNTVQLWALWDGSSAPSDVIPAYNEAGCGCKGPRGHWEKQAGHMGITSLQESYGCEFPEKLPKVPGVRCLKSPCEAQFPLRGQNYEVKWMYSSTMNVFPCHRQQNGLPFCGNEGSAASGAHKKTLLTLLYSSGPKLQAPFTKRGGEKKAGHRVFCLP